MANTRRRNNGVEELLPLLNIWLNWAVRANGTEANLFIPKTGEVPNRKPHKESEPWATRDSLLIWLEKLALEMKKNGQERTPGISLRAILNKFPDIDIILYGVDREASINSFKLTPDEEETPNRFEEAAEELFVKDEEDEVPF